MKKLDNPFYYLENFRHVLVWVNERYSDLLEADEQAFIGQFLLLPQPSQALLVRMVMRKGEFFRASKLIYEEIGAAEEAVQPLLAQGWVNDNPALTLEQFFPLLRKDEIGALFGKLLPKTASRKAQQLEALLPVFTQAQPYQQWNAASSEPLYQLCINDLCNRLRLMYFGNLAQDWSEFVLRDLGIYHYESVEFSASSRGFQSRGDIDDYLHLYQCRERFYAEQPVEEIILDIPQLPYTNPWIENRRAKLLFMLGQHLERAQDWTGASELYQRCGYPGARVRLIRMLERRDNPKEAYQLASFAEQCCENEAERQALQRILPRLRRKLSLPKFAPPRTAPPDEMTLVLPPPEQPKPVELVVRDHFEQQGTTTVYVENALINSLFGLLCWKAMFLPLPGAFFHPFHAAPADLHSPDFYTRREQAFAACFAELESGAYRQTILQHFNEKFGLQSPFVFWGLLSEDLLQLALACLPALHLRKCFEWIVQDVKANRSGFPDLIQFWPDEQRYRMIEVKGPGDRLQDNQVRWIDYCRTHQIPVSVCYVQWEGTDR